MIGVRSVSFAVLVLGVLFAVLGSVSDASAQSTAEDLLAKDFAKAKAIRSMPKDVTLYHYFNLRQNHPEFQTPQGRVGYMTRYLTQVTGRFWDKTYHADSFVNAGPGLYLAVDPESSRVEFGPEMIELVVPAGAKYIAVVESIPISEATKQALLNERIVTNYGLIQLFSKTMDKKKTKDGFWRNTFEYMTLPENEVFRDLVQRLMAKNDIRFIEYNWRSNLDGFCKATSVSAFVYVGSQDVNNSKLGVIDPAYRAMSFISHYPLEGLTAQEIQMKERTEKWSEFYRLLAATPRPRQAAAKRLAGERFTVDEIQEMRRKTFRCD